VKGRKPSKIYVPLANQRREDGICKYEKARLKTSLEGGEERVFIKADALTFEKESSGPVCAV